MWLWIDRPAPQNCQLQILPRYRNLDNVVEGIPPCRLSSGLSDQVSQTFLSYPNRCLTTGHMSDSLVHHRAVEVVGTTVLTLHSVIQTTHDPVGFDIGEVVQHESTHGHLAQDPFRIHKVQLTKGRILWMETKRDVG